MRPADRVMFDWREGELLRVADAARILALSPRKVRGLIDRGVLESRRIDGAVRVTVASVLQLSREGAEPAHPTPRRAVQRRAQEIMERIQGARHGAPPRAARRQKRARRRSE